MILLKDLRSILAMTRQTLNHGDSSNFFLDRKFEQKIGLSQPLIYDVFEKSSDFFCKADRYTKIQQHHHFSNHYQTSSQVNFQFVQIRLPYCGLASFQLKNQQPKNLPLDKNIGTFKTSRELDIDVSSSTNKGGIFCFHQFMLGGFFSSSRRGGEKTTNSWTPS